MTVYFAVKKLWSLIRSHLSILAFVANAFGVLVMKFCLLLCPEWFCLDYLLGFYSAKFYVYVFNTSGVNFSVKCQEGVYCLLSAYG